jgi:hypothetical protein
MTIQVVLHSFTLKYPSFLFIDTLFVVVNMHGHTVVPTEMFDPAINTLHTDESDRYNHKVLTYIEYRAVSGLCRDY